MYRKNTFTKNKDDFAIKIKIHVLRIYFKYTQFTFTLESFFFFFKSNSYFNKSSVICKVAF